MRVCISSTFTAEPINRSLGFWLAELGYKFDIEFGPFNQVFQSLLDPQSIFALNQGGVNVVLVRWQDLGADYKAIPIPIDCCLLSLLSPVPGSGCWADGGKA